MKPDPNPGLQNLAQEPTDPPSGVIPFGDPPEALPGALTSVWHGLAVGDRVRCEREAPAKGTWLQYAGRVGTVRTFNRRDGEVAVDLSPSGNSSGGWTWFRRNELVRVDR